MTDAPMTDADIRAYVLASAADDQTGEAAVYPRGLHDRGTMWQIGSLRFWKCEAYRQMQESAQAAPPFPPYRRASLEWALFPDMRLEGERFKMRDGRDATAILLRSDKNPEGTFATFALTDEEASRMIALLNAELDATRAIAKERFLARGGDPAALSGQQAPSAQEMFSILGGTLGVPDDDER